MAPATDNAGVIWGWMGSPSMCVVFELLVTFSEPLGIGVAVTPAELLDEADPEVLPVPFADEALAPALLEDGAGLEEST